MTISDSMLLESNPVFECLKYETSEWSKVIEVNHGDLSNKMCNETERNKCPGESYNL